MKIILIRHGQYKPQSETQSEQLTKLGRTQAKLIGKRLRDYKIDQIFVSTMPRALETAELILKEIDYKKKMIKTDLLRECIPGFPLSLQKKYGLTDTKRFKKDIIQSEKAFKNFINVKLNAKNTNKTVLIVCHGNIIRYLACKVLGIETLKWVKLDILQCSLSIFELRNQKEEKMKLISFNDVGHIPISKQTFI